MIDLDISMIELVDWKWNSSLDMTSMTSDFAFVNIKITWLSAGCALLERGPMVADFKEAGSGSTVTSSGRFNSAGQFFSHFWYNSYQEYITWKTWNEENVRSFLEVGMELVDRYYGRQGFAPMVAVAVFVPFALPGRLALCRLWWPSERGPSCFPWS